MARVLGPISLAASSACGNGARLGAEIERHRLDALHAQPHVVIEVVRTRQDHLVAGLGDAHQRQAEGLVAARSDADLAGRDRRTVELGEMGGIVLAQCRQAEDRRVAVHRRIEQQLAQMAAQFEGRWISRHRLAQVDQRPIGGKGAAQHPAFGLADGRRLDGGEPGICGRNMLHLSTCCRRCSRRPESISHSFHARMPSPAFAGGRSIRVCS